MWWERERQAYLRRHWGRYTPGKLARAVDWPKARVEAYAKRAKLHRTAAERQATRNRSEAEPPPYTGLIEPIDGEPCLRRTQACHEADSSPGRSRWLNAAPHIAVFILALVVYVLTLGPTVTGEDSGELVTAAYELGVPHPPGYPAWVLSAHPFTWLPFGNVGMP